MGGHKGLEAARRPERGARGAVARASLENDYTEMGAPAGEEELQKATMTTMTPRCEKVIISCDSCAG